MACQRGDVAIRLEYWQDVIKFNKEIMKSKEARGANSYEMARTAFNNYGPLMVFNRHEEVRRLLNNCLEVFKENNDIKWLHKVFGAQAHLEYKLGHLDQAVGYVQNSLRYSYRAADAIDCAIDHNNLAEYMIANDSQSRTAIAHRIAAAMISFQTKSEMLAGDLQSIAFLLSGSGQDSIPVSFDELCRIVDEVEGVHFSELFDQLPLRAADGDQVLQRVLEMAAGKIDGA